jgi:hypothetical protein
MSVSLADENVDKFPKRPTATAIVTFATSANLFGDRQNMLTPRRYGIPTFIGFANHDNNRTEIFDCGILIEL